MSMGMSDFKQYYDTLVLFINPPDPVGAAKTILKGGANGLLTVCDLLLGVYSDIDKAEASGESWFSGKEWLDKDYCMENMKENLTEQIEALDKLTGAAGELEESWRQTQPGSDAPHFRIREVIPLEIRSQAYQVLHYMWKFLIAERRRLFYWAQWKRMESPPQLEIAYETLEMHEEYMEEQRTEARKIEAMAESIKSMAA